MHFYSQFESSFLICLVLMMVSKDADFIKRIEGRARGERDSGWVARVSIRDNSRLKSAILDRYALSLPMVNLM
jgi:hypothetical protein